MKKKGFTLIELLAVIVILAIIALIATPAVLNIIEDSKEKSRLETVNSLIRTTKIYAGEALLKNYSLDGNLYDEIKSRVKGKIADTGEIFIDSNNEIALAVKLDGVCYMKEFNEEQAKKVDKEDCTLNLNEICDGVVKEVMSSYKIDEANCKSYFGPQFGTGISEEELTTFCTGGKIQDVMDIDLVIEIGGISIDDLISNEVFYDIVMEEKCQTCIETINTVTSYTINKETCLAVFSTLDDPESFCSGNESNGVTLDQNIKEDGAYPFILLNVLENVVYNTNEIEIANYKCGKDNTFGMPENTDIVIPNKIGGKPVVGISSGAFSSAGLTSVDFSETTNLRYIGATAFLNDSIGGTIDLSKNTNLKKIKASFQGNNVEKAILPSSVKELDFTFAYNYNLASVNFEDLINLETIGSYTFYGYKGETVDLSNSTKLTEIGESAFEENSINTLLFPSSIETIGKSAFFSRDSSISNINLEDLTNLKTLDLSSIRLSDDFTSIDLSKTKLSVYNGGIYGNSVETVKLPSTLKEIGAGAFASSKIKTVNFEDLNNLEVIGNSAFASNFLTGTLDLTVLPKLKTIGSSAFDYNNLNSVKIPNSVTSIGNYAFRKSNGSTLITSNGTTNYLGNQNLTSIIIDNTTGSIPGSPWGATNATISWLR